MAEAPGKNIHNLSYGQKKRVCIAGLLAMGHEILLLDEPTAGLDPVGEQRMMELLASLNRDHGVTVVMATHSVDLVPLFLHRLHILNRGRVVTSGTPEEVFTTPDALAAVRLRLPHVTELFHLARHVDRIPFNTRPLTIGAARQVLAETFIATGAERH
jgi:cobalt/nickel transport system ATP-binding protein